jgi:signal peptidase I
VSSKLKVIFAITVVSGIFFRIFFFSSYKSVSPSMIPNILAGDTVLVNQSAYGVPIPWLGEIYFKTTPRKNDLIVFTEGAKYYIRRVLAVPGDLIKISNGIVTINSQECQYQSAPIEYPDSGKFFIENCNGVSRVILRPEMPNSELELTDFSVLPDTVFVGIDNRHQDSQNFVLGSVKNEQIVGKVLIVGFSYASTQDFISVDRGVRWNRILTNVK